MQKSNIVALLDNIRLLEKRVSLILVDTALTLSQFRLLCILYYGEEALPATALSSQLGISKASVTAQLKTLDQAGLIQDKPVPGDRRSLLISLSNAGRQRMKVTLENLWILEKQIPADAMNYFLEGLPSISTTTKKRSTHL